MLWDIQKEIFCQQLAQISLQRANNCLYSGRFWFKMPKKHKTSQKVAECKVENLLLSNITSTEVYVQYGCNKFQAQLRLRFQTISPTVWIYHVIVLCIQHSNTATTYNKPNTIQFWQSGNCWPLIGRALSCQSHQKVQVIQHCATDF